jgi:hypothetical protein
VFYKIIEDYAEIIRDYTVAAFKRYDNASSLVASIEFTDQSVLYIRDYLFLNGSRKYSFHWQDNSGNLISRWDNSPHHKETSTFPHHCHLQGKVKSSHERNLVEIIKIIDKKLYK